MYYDSNVRESIVEVGDRVLIRNVGLKGKNKLADKRARDTYNLINQINSDILVFKVKKESGNEKIKTLHRNMLLPISLSLFFIFVWAEQNHLNTQSKWSEQL